MSVTTLPRGRSSSRIACLYGLLIVANLAAWAWAWTAFAHRPALLGTALLAWVFGLRHAVDADHIAAIDNVVRKLMQERRRPITVGLWFSLGHSTVVVLASIAIAGTAAALQGRLDAAKEIGGVVGTAVTAAFLLVIAAVNIITLRGIWRSFAAVRRGEPLAADRAAQRRHGQIRVRRHRHLRGVLDRVVCDLSLERPRADRRGRNLTVADSGSLSARLRHVYWVGGGSGAGKSTIARRLATQHGLRLYSTDDAMADHGRRSRPEDCPSLTEFKKMSMDERWVDRSPETMFETFHWFRGEGFGLIAEDLLQLPPDEGVIVEGFRLLPLLVKPLLHDPRQGVWLIPTPEFRLAAFASRGPLLSIAARTSNPERALSNVLERDRLFTAYLRDAATKTGVPVIGVDTRMTESVLEHRVATLFGLRSGRRNFDGIPAAGDIDP